MKTIAIKKPSKAMDSLLQAAKVKDVILQSPNGDEFLVVAIDDFGQEIARKRANKELMSFLHQRFRDANRRRSIPLVEVKKRLGLKSAPKGAARTKHGPPTKG
jgi:hypothetical protein